MKYVGIAVTVIILGIVAFATIKNVSPVGWGWWGTTNTSSGVALHGHDHRLTRETRDGVLIFNPGECAGHVRGRNAVGVLDLTTLQSETLNF